MTDDTAAPGRRIAKANEVNAERLARPLECLVCGGELPSHAPECGTNHCTDRRACVQNCPWCCSDANLRGAW